MPRGPAPAWRHRKEPVVDDWIMASVNAAGGPGKHDASGHYALLVIKGLADRDEAEEWHDALNRCAHWMHRNKVISVSMSATIKRDGSRYLIEFRAIDKVAARAYVMRKYGPDPSKWPYDPRRRGGS